MAALGIVVYRVEKDGSLTGKFPNTSRKRNEIAKKIKGGSRIEGQYVCCFIDSDNRLHTGEMTIKEHAGVYHFSQQVFNMEAGQGLFKGVAVQEKEDEIIVLFS